MTNANDVNDAVASAFGRVPPGREAEFDRDVADFKRVGLKGRVAEKAARGYGRGTYRSFEEAAVMASAFGDLSAGVPSRVDQDILAEVVKTRADSGVGEPV